MNILDCIFLSVLLAGFVVGIIQGLIKQLFSMGGLICGIICGALWYNDVAVVLSRSMHISDNAVQILAFVLILIVVPLLFSLVGSLFSKIIKCILLAPVDRILGGLFGALKYFIVLALLIRLMDFVNVRNLIIDEKQIESSILYSRADRISRDCLGWVWSRIEPLYEMDSVEDSEREKVI